MKTSVYILRAFSIVLLAANLAGAAEVIEYPRYIPPAQTRDEIIAEELRRQETPGRVTPVIIRFAEGKSVVKPEYQKALAELAAYLKAHPEATATINGYTDNAGTPAANLEMSERRARKVREILVKEFKIDVSRLDIVGWGGKNPVASNSTAAGRQKNRRVEIFIGSK